MIPYLEPPVLAIGPLNIHAFSVLLVIAIVWARWTIARRTRRFGLSGEVMAGLCIAMLVSGFVGAHLVKTIVPNIPAFIADPSVVLRSTRGIASLGGLGGGLLGGILYCRIRGFSTFDTLRMLDVVAYSLPAAWMFGRLGCALAHDHRGLWTSNPLGVRFPEGTRWDLGAVEFFFLIGMAILFRRLDQHPRPAGFFFGLFGVVYGSFRIWLDTLHYQPLRFLGGATAIVIGLTGWILMARHARNEPLISRLTAPAHN